MSTLIKEYLQERVNEIISRTNLILEDFNPKLYQQHIEERVEINPLNQKKLVTLIKNDKRKSMQELQINL